MSNLSQVKNIIAVGSGKGGVGKSTVAVNVAVALSRQGFKVGLLDADIYGPSQPRLLGAGDKRADMSHDDLVPLVEHGVSFISVGVLMAEDGPVVWRAPMATRLIQQFLANVAWGELDYLLIDMPPGTGDVQLTLAQSASLTGSLIVTTPQDVALGIAKKGIQMFQGVNVPILGVVENMSGFHCAKCGEVNNIFKEGGGRRLAKEMNIPFLGALPLDPAIVQGGDDGQPLLVRSPQSPAALAVVAITQELLKQVEKQQGDTGLQPQKIEQTPEGDLVIQWPDGHAGRWTQRHLRLSCSCAACVNEATGVRSLDPAKVPAGIRVLRWNRVGRYGLAILFSDSHSTGIYTFKNLRALCECPACQASHHKPAPTTGASKA